MMAGGVAERLAGLPEVVSLVGGKFDGWDIITDAPSESFALLPVDDGELGPAGTQPTGAAMCPTLGEVQVWDDDEACLYRMESAGRWQYRFSCSAPYDSRFLSD